jgi:2-polyprenyl-3-methyl-5-hydroxy-6-metoxy-1,4-benzoquinol methylase
MVAWHGEDGALTYADERTVFFHDTIDHWHNGVCRLLGVSDSVGRRWVEEVVRLASEQHGRTVAELPEVEACAVLATGWITVAGDPLIPCRTEPLAMDAAAAMLGFAPDVVLASAVRDDPNLVIIGSSVGQLGWTVDAATLAQPVEQTVVYEDTYFEGAQLGIGYGNYLAQQGWRLEKARRLVRQLEGLVAYLGIPLCAPPTLLDVGAGYGFFRKAADERAWQHYGIEVSEFAARTSRELFGFESSVGLIEAFDGAPLNSMDVVTLFDVIEHVIDPLALLRHVRRLVHEAGIVFIRTPNVTALERDVFGARYHSFKAEHLYYFGPHSLVDALQQAGFEVGFLTTESHLLRGFFPGRLQGFARQLRGSDLVAVGIKKSS